MTQGHFAVSFLRAFAWIGLVATIFLTAWYIVQAADLSRNVGGLGNNVTGLLFLTALSGLAGGLLFWAVFIALATITQNSIDIKEMIARQQQDAYEQQEYRERRVARRYPR